MFTPKNNFNPRTPCGVRLYDDVYFPVFKTFQSTHPLRGATFRTVREGLPQPISIHAPLAGCDFQTMMRTTKLSLFQSTHPLRGATRISLLVSSSRPDFNPRTPCGVRLSHAPVTSIAKLISIHAPLAGCDLPRNCGAYFGTYFNPRTPCGVRHLFSFRVWIEINFNPRTPCGVRPTRFRLACGA